MLIPLDKIKLHLRLDCEPSSELDPELARMYGAALAYVCNFTNKTISELCISPSEQILQPDVESAVLLMIGDLFSNREAVGNPQHTAHTTIERLLHFHRKGLGA